MHFQNINADFSPCLQSGAGEFPPNILPEQGLNNNRSFIKEKKKSIGFYGDWVPRPSHCRLGEPWRPRPAVLPAWLLSALVLGGRSLGAVFKLQCVTGFSGAPSLCCWLGRQVPGGLWERTTHWRNHILLYLVGMGPGLGWAPLQCSGVLFSFSNFLFCTGGRAS